MFVAQWQMSYGQVAAVLVAQAGREYRVWAVSQMVEPDEVLLEGFVRNERLASQCDASTLHSVCNDVHAMLPHVGMCAMQLLLAAVCLLMAQATPA